MKNPFRRDTSFNLKSLFEKYHLENIKLNTIVLKGEVRITDVGRSAAWELYVEMLTRVVTQPLPSEDGDDKTALDSVYSLFPTTRKILCRHGPKAVQFAKIAIPILNQKIRPFTTKWHRLSLTAAFDDEAKKTEFREELEELQATLRDYNRMLAEIAGVEDMTDLENTEGEIR